MVCGSFRLLFIGPGCLWNVSTGGMIILATNRPFDLDEAMHRRITLAIEFQKPATWHMSFRSFLGVFKGLFYGF